MFSFALHREWDESVAVPQQSDRKEKQGLRLGAPSVNVSKNMQSIAEPLLRFLDLIMLRTMHHGNVAASYAPVLS